MTELFFHVDFRSDPKFLLSLQRSKIDNCFSTDVYETFFSIGLRLKMAEKVSLCRNLVAKSDYQDFLSYLKNIFWINFRSL